MSKHATLTQMPKWSKTDPLAAHHQAVAEFVPQVLATGFSPCNETEAGKKRIAKFIANLPTPEIAACATVLAEWVVHYDRLSANLTAKNENRTDAFERVWHPRQTIHYTLRLLLRRKLPFELRGALALAEWITPDKQISDVNYPVTGIIRALTDFVASAGLPPELRATLCRAVGALRGARDRQMSRNADEIERLLQVAPPAPAKPAPKSPPSKTASPQPVTPSPKNAKAAARPDVPLKTRPGKSAPGGARPKVPLKEGEAWSDLALAEIAGSHAWAVLLDHARTAIASNPSAAWLTRATELLNDVSPAEFAARLSAWLPLVAKPRTKPLAAQSWRDAYTDAQWLMEETNSNILRGLCWTATLAADHDLARELAALVATSLKKLPGIGPRFPKIANAAIFALGASSNPNALAQLARLKISVKFGTAQKALEKALNVVARRLNVSRDDLDELGVPTYGFSSDGTQSVSLGSARADIRLTTAGVEIAWFNAAGKSVKDLPADVRKNHSDTLKELKASAADADKMLSAQKTRLDNLMILPKTWKYSDFLQRYLQHPLVACAARRLIWIVDGTPVLFRTDTPENLAGKTLKCAPAAPVSLWHPVARPAAEVLAWRQRLADLQITQPFKQAHREVYLLTDAERRTNTYSNRFAAHILRQHQFNALCAARGWKNKLRLMVDDTYPPATRQLPLWSLRAEFWIEGIGDTYGTDTNESGVFHRLSTDQVRFYRTDAADNLAHAGGGGYTTNADGAGQGNINEPLPLDQIPPLVLSEILRDVDLFVGVASVGNDPTWADGGPEGRYRTYWQTYSFGDLTQTAQTRKQVLATLLPRLKIAQQCSLTDKFLRVQGALRAYKIHLGSGNILMEPNDHYLCIVPHQSAKSSPGDLYLPFEGDQTLAVILSKAFLLANDKKISDPTITRQIQP